MKSPNEYWTAIAEAKALLEPDGHDTSNPSYREYARGMVELLASLYCGSMTYKSKVAADIGLDAKLVA